MWIITTLGFVSIVQHRSQPDVFLVRARVEADLRALLSSAALTSAVSETVDADYRFRATVTPAELRKLFAVLADAIDYPNFKSAVAARGGSPSRLAAYHAVWHDLAELQQ